MDFGMFCFGSRHGRYQNDIEYITFFLDIL